MKLILTFCVSLCLFLMGTLSSAENKPAPVKISTFDKHPITSPRCNIFTFDASNSSDPDNEHISIFWDFGDGETSSKTIEEHTYKTSGDYNVTLTISDNSGLECSTAVVSQLVRANIPPAVNLTAPDAVCVNDKITIDSTASSFEGKKLLSLFWDFSDGTTSSGTSQVTKSYTKGGDYSVTLTVDDNNGTVCSKNTASKTIHVNAPPVVDIGPKEILRCLSEGETTIVDFDASNTTDPNGDPLMYEWDFGDGQSGDGVRVSHEYTNANNYDVKLVVKDGTNMNCGTGVGFTTVKISEVPRAEAGDDLLGCPDESMTFDGSNSFVNKKGTVSAKWFFGDGQTGDGLKTTHIYKKPGKYQAALQLENKLNPMCSPSRDTRDIVINSMPTVTLKSDESVCLGNKISFDASSAADPDGDNLEFYWSFGDGTILKDGPKVTHEYREGGQYRVTVIVDDGKGTSCSTVTATTMVKANTPPTADAGPNTTCCVSTESEFNANASTDPDGDHLTYIWDFGDGSTSEGAVVRHSYAKSGQYKVLLTVDDNSGTACSKAIAGFTASANAAPVPVMSIR